jgi:hypothetical protein
MASEEMWRNIMQIFKSQVAKIIQDKDTIPEIIKTIFS